MIVSIVGGGGFFTFVQINNILMEILKSSIICSNTSALIVKQKMKTIILSLLVK